MIHRSLILAAVALAGCDPHPPIPTDEPDRGTQELAAGAAGTLPRGVTRDLDGKWTLESAPPVDPDKATPPSAMRPLNAGAALTAFAEAPPDPRRAQEGAGGSMTSDLVLRTTRARLVIDRGCLRLDQPGRPLVRFMAAPLLQRDAQGYLVIGGHDADGRAAYARIGEPLTWELGTAYTTLPDGSLGPPLVTDPAALAPIRAACGEGPVVMMTPAPTSLAREQVARREAAVRDYVALYGGSEAAARRRFAGCDDARPCALSPPPPVMSQAQCPPATVLNAGLCRTKEGFVRPEPPPPVSPARP